MEIKWRGAHSSSSGPFALIAMGEHHERAIPFRGHAQEVVRPLVHTLAHLPIIGRAADFCSKGDSEQRHRNKFPDPHHSTTASARASNVGETAIPKAFAVPRFTTSCTLVN